MPVMSLCVCKFVGTTVLLCDFHREQAWLRWVTNSRNGVDPSDKEQLLAVLRNVARSDSVEKFTAAVDILTRSAIWKSNVGLQNWFSRKWLTHYKVSVYSNVCSTV